MAWKECRVEESRLEFVRLAAAEGANFSELCRRFGVSRKTGYKWTARFASPGADAAALSDRSRRPKSSPGRMAALAETRVVELRALHRSWGGRKIAALLRRERLAAVSGGGPPGTGVPTPAPVPSPSSVTRALRRHGLIDPAESERRREPRRFERPEPNDLWQMDFKGHFPLGDGTRCHPLTVLDDHSRYSVVLAACDNERGVTVRGHLTAAFKRYGLPRELLADNGSPWGASGWRIGNQWTVLTVWLLRLGVGVIHGRPGHPQTQGKEERFHRTLVDDLLRWGTIGDMAEAGRSLAEYRRTYNHVRPHEALAGMASPGMVYAVSPRAYPAELPEVRYGAGDVVCPVNANGRMTLRKRAYVMGKPFASQDLALRPTTRAGLWEVYYCRHRVGWLDETTGETVGPRATGPLAALLREASDRPR